MIDRTIEVLHTNAEYEHCLADNSFPVTNMTALTITDADIGKAKSRPSKNLIDLTFQAKNFAVSLPLSQAGHQASAKESFTTSPKPVSKS